jgi:hypothetical protein
MDIFLWGVVGIIQACFLPGVFLAGLFMRGAHWFIFIPVAFCLSLLSNYILVMLLVILGFYTKSTMLTIVCIEFVTILYLYKKGKPSNLSYKESLKDTPRTLFDLLVQCFLFVAVAWSFWIFFKSLGNVFTGWDAVVSWNRWAASWGNNKLPVLVWNYPQLLPILMSIPYVLMKRVDIELFSYAINALFLPVSFIYLYSLKLCPPVRLGAIGCLVAVYFFIKKIGVFQSIGHADIPIMLLALSSLISMLHWKHSGYKLHFLAISIAFACLSSLTKQAGLFLILMIHIYLIAEVKGKSTVVPAKQFILLLASSLIIVAPWYIYVRYNIQYNGWDSEIKYVTQGIHQSRTYLERIVYAFGHWRELGVCALLSALCLLWKEIRAFAFIGVSYYLVWALFFSYDLRNVALALPFIGLSIGFLVEKCLHFRTSIKEIQSGTSKISNHKPVVACILAFAFLIMGDNIDKLVEKRNYNRQIERGLGKEMNLKILEVTGMYNEKLLSRIQYIPYIPGFNKEQYVLVHTPEMFCKKGSTLHKFYGVIETPVKDSYISCLNDEYHTKVIFESAGFEFICTEIVFT